MDAICNNAAWVIRSNIENTNAEFFDKVMAVNVRAPMLMIQAALAELKKNAGCVVNIGSVNGHCGEPSFLAYSTSKGALMTMSRNLADDLGPAGVRINHFNVGWVLTPNERKVQADNGQPDGWENNIPRQFAPSGRLIRPEEIATAAVYWLGDESRSYNRHCIGTRAISDHRPQSGEGVADGAWLTKPLTNNHLMTNAC